MTFYVLTCAYSITHLFKELLAGLNKYLFVNSKKGAELFYINIHKIQSPYVIIIYYIYHIQGTIITQRFTYASEKVNSDPTPFNSDITFELAISDILPTTPAELHHLEEC